MTNTNRKPAEQIIGDLGGDLSSAIDKAMIGAITDAIDTATGRGVEAERHVAELMRLYEKKRSDEPPELIAARAFLANASPPVTTAEAERARIVAWLRSQTDTDPVIHQLYADLADAIESGAHMEAHDG